MVADTETKNVSSSLKFLCSYGGRILPRSTDGKLRYVGGLTRVLAVDRSCSFSVLMVKLGDLCGQPVNLRCQLPDGDLETLVSVKSDEDLAVIVQEYDRFCGRKIRSILSPPKPLKKISSPSSGDLSPKSPFSAVGSPLTPTKYAMSLTPCCCLPQMEYYGVFRRRYYGTRRCSCFSLRNPGV